MSCQTFADLSVSRKEWEILQRPLSALKSCPSPLRTGTVNVKNSSVDSLKASENELATQ